MDSCKLSNNWKRSRLVQLNRLRRGVVKRRDKAGEQVNGYKAMDFM